MKAKYYRFIYQNVEEGVCCTGSMAESGGKEEPFHFLYLGGGSGGCEVGEEELQQLEGHFHLVLLGDFEPLTIKRAGKVFSWCRADQVMYPYLAEEDRKSLAGELSKTGNFTNGEVGLVADPERYLKDRGIAEGNAVKDRSAFLKGNRRFRVFCVGEGKKKSLVLYHGSEGGSPKTEECLLNVKPVLPSRCCSPFVDPQNLNCEMKCMLYNDFTQCKRHNQKNGTYFVDGHLVLGMGMTDTDLGEVRKALDDVWDRIRVVCLAEADGPMGRKEELLQAGTEETAQYFVGNSDTKETVVHQILMGNPYRTYVAVNKKAGLCLSGCYTQL